jgi:hypothetical protein
MCSAALGERLRMPCATSILACRLFVQSAWADRHALGLVLNRAVHSSSRWSTSRVYMYMHEAVVDTRSVLT